MTSADWTIRVCKPCLKERGRYSAYTKDGGCYHCGSREFMYVRIVDAKGGQK